MEMQVFRYFLKCAMVKKREVVRTYDAYTLVTTSSRNSALCVFCPWTTRAQRRQSLPSIRSRPVFFLVLLYEERPVELYDPKQTEKDARRPTHPFTSLCHGIHSVWLVKRTQKRAKPTSTAPPAPNRNLDKKKKKNAVCDSLQKKKKKRHDNQHARHLPHSFYLLILNTCSCFQK